MAPWLLGYNTLTTEPEPLESFFGAELGSWFTSLPSVSSLASRFWKELNVCKVANMNEGWGAGDGDGGV